MHASPGESTIDNAGYIRGDGCDAVCSKRQPVYFFLGGWTPDRGAGNVSGTAVDGGAYLGRRAGGRVGGAGGK